MNEKIIVGLNICSICRTSVDKFLQVMVFEITLKKIISFEGIFSAALSNFLGQATLIPQ